MASTAERPLGVCVCVLPHYLLLIHSGEAFAPYTWPEQMEGADEDKSASLSSGEEKK